MQMALQGASAYQRFDGVELGDCGRLTGNLPPILVIDE
jgi:hypothetical protein